MISNEDILEMRRKLDGHRYFTRYSLSNMKYGVYKEHRISPIADLIGFYLTQEEADQVAKTLNEKDI